MNWLDTQMAVLDAATGAVGFAINWLLQSTMLIAAGLTIGRLLRTRGSAVQSVVLRTTLAAVLVCPLATQGLSLAGVSGWSVKMPRAWSRHDADDLFSTVDSPDPATASGLAEPIGTPVLPTALPPLFAEERGAENTASSQPTSLAFDETSTIQVPSIIAGSSSEKFPGPQTAGISIHRFGMVSLAVMAIWLCVSFVLTSRLATAWKRLSRLRREAVQADANTIEICQQFASRLNVSAPDVLRSPCLPSPCLAGIRRPAVLLPEVDKSLSIREVLIHELAHLKRRDCHWNLLRQIATAAFFFQPLLWKLSRALESAAEEVCDDYVVEFGGDRQEYAHGLVDIAELSSVPVTVAGVGIVSLRSMLAKRVSRIMDTSRTLSTRVGNLLLVCVIAGGLLGTTITGFLGLGPRASQAEVQSVGNQRDAGSDKEEQNLANGVTAEDNDLITVHVQDNTSREYEGKVVDPAGTPVEDAHLYLVFHIPQPTGLLTPTWKPVATTGSKGAFRFTASPADFGVHATEREFGYSTLVAVKPGFGFAWSQAGKYETSGKWLRDARNRLNEVPAEFLEQVKHMLSGAGEPLQLVMDDQPIRGRIVDINGQPVTGARLTLLEVGSGIGDDLTAWREAADAPKSDYYSARMKTPVSMNGPQVRSLVKPAVTDNDGSFTLRGVGNGRIAELLLEGPGIESAKIFTRTEAGEQITLLRERRSPDLGSYIYYPAELTYVAGPSAAVTGVVRDAQTHEPLSGVTVKSQSRHGEQINGWGQDFVRAVTDGEGKFRLEGMPIGSDNRIAAIAPQGDVAYFSMSKRASTTSQERPLEVDFDLMSGVWIEGRITDKQTGEGLSGTLAYYVKKESPSYKFARSLDVDQRDRLLSDDDGRFRIAALPGPGFVTFMAHEHQDYPRADVILKADGSRERVGRTMLETGPSILMPQNYHLVAEINPLPDAKRLEFNLQLDGGNSVVGRVVGPDDQPLTGYYYAGQMAQFDTWESSTGDRFELKGYDPDVPRRVYFAHGERKLAGHVTVEGEASEDLVVKLQPAGEVKGRLVDGDGAPLANCQLVPWRPPMSSPADLGGKYRAPPLPHNTANWQTGQYETDQEGRFQISHLAPGVEYRIRAFDLTTMTPARGRAPKFNGPLEVVIQVQPGESKDLGDVRLASEAEFNAAAKKTNEESNVVQTKRQSVVTGRIAFASGAPAADAHVAVIAMRVQPPRGGDLSPGSEVLAEGQADDNGNYRLTLEGVSSKTHRFASLIARKDGMAVAWKGINLHEAGVEASLTLPAEELIRGKLVDIEGQPAADIHLLVQTITKRSEDGVPGLSVEFFGEQTPAAWIQPVSTDDQGRFEIHGVSEPHGVRLTVVDSDRFAPQEILLNTGELGDRDYRPLMKNVGRGEEAVLVLAPAQVLEGVITYEDTGLPVPHARVKILASQQGNTTIPLAGTADADGKYRISPPPGIRFDVIAYPPDGVPYLVRQTEKPIIWQDGDTSRQANVALPRGVLVRGKVVEADSNAPVQGVAIQYVPEAANNPNIADDIVTGWQAIHISNERGGFEFGVLPGPGRLLLHGPEGKYVLREIGARQLFWGKPGGRRNYAHAVHEINPDHDTGQIDVTISLQPGATVAGQIVDEKGEPVAEALVITRLINYAAPTSLTWQGNTPPTLGGRFELSCLEVGKEYPVHFLDAKRRIGATVNLQAGRVSQTVVLRPCGNAQARILDSQGEPRVGIRVALEMVVTPGPHQLDREAGRRGELLSDAALVEIIDNTNYRLGRPKTDDQGNITFPALIPGATYTLTVFEDGDGYKPNVLKQFSVESGETLDLGDITFPQYGQSYTLGL